MKSHSFIKFINIKMFFMEKLLNLQLRSICFLFGDFSKNSMSFFLKSLFHKKISQQCILKTQQILWFISAFVSNLTVLSLQFPMLFWPWPISSSCPFPIPSSVTFAKFYHFCIVAVVICFVFFDNFGWRTKAWKCTRDQNLLSPFSFHFRVRSQTTHVPLPKWKYIPMYLIIVPCWKSFSFCFC